MEEHPIGFFDRKNLNGACGAGLVINIGKDKVIKGWLNVGIGTNTRAKVVGLWSLLFCTKFLGIKEKNQLCYLPVFLMREVWKARNASIFSNFMQKTEVIYLKILSTFF